MATGPHPITKQLLYLLVLAFLPLLPAVACAETDSTITIGYPENFPPYYSIDDQGKPVGFAIEVIEDLARQLKLPVEHRWFNSWSETIGALEAQQIDLIPNIGITPEWQRFTLFTAPVEEFSVSIFVPKDAHAETISDLRDKLVAVVRANVGRKLIAEYPRLKPRVFDTSSAAIIELLSGRVAGLAYPEPVVWRTVEEMQLQGKLRPVEPPLATIRRAIGVSLHRAELRKRLDAALPDYLHSESYERTYLKWFARPQRYWNFERVFWLMAKQHGVIIVVEVGA